MKLALVSLMGIVASGCGLFQSSEYPPLQTVPSVDLARYAGRWYEIASIPVRQQRGCSCTTAEYSLLEEGVVRVVNACRKPDGEDRVEGKAFVVPNSNNAKLRVQFFWPFRGDYWVIDLAEDYSYAVVGTPSREYCWILARSPRMPDDTLALLKSRLEANGFTTARMQKTVHDCGG
jgi:apolipoprotein D and lipocalin family protein